MSAWETATDAGASRAGAIAGTLRSAAPAGIAALLMYLASANGLIYPDNALALQVGLLCGAVAGLIADGLTPGVGAAVAACGIGLVVSPPRSGIDAAGVLTLLAAAAVTACAARLLASRPRGRAFGAALVVVALALNLWATVYIVQFISLESRGRVSVVEELTTRPPAGVHGPDSDMYREVAWNIHDGMPFYAAYAKAWGEVFPGVQPHSIFDLRQPALFELWGHLPGWPRSALWAFFAFALLAMAAAPLVSRDAAGAVAGTAASAAIGAYLFAFIVARRMLFMFEPWAGSLVVVCLAAFALARRGKHHRAWLVTAAAVAVAAVAIRELAVFLMVAGIASAFAAPREERRFDIAVWLAALGTSAVLYGLHVSRALALIPKTPRLGGAWMFNGGFGYLARGILDFTIFLNPHAWVIWLFAALGVAGALAQPDRRFRVFACVAMLLPLAAFLVVGNTAVDVRTGYRMNYWGAIVMPSLLALAPSALLLLPGLRRLPPASATEEQDEGGRQEQAAVGA
jgi:hypothetical protein